MRQFKIAAFLSAVEGRKAASNATVVVTVVPAAASATTAFVQDVGRARHMEALFRTFRDEPWCRGSHWWKRGRQR